MACTSALNHIQCGFFFQTLKLLFCRFSGAYKDSVWIVQMQTKYQVGLYFHSTNVNKMWGDYLVTNS